jgi:two-component system, chemotaxis family, chemotaxis protein CheV
VRNLRGQVIPVIDLAMALGLRSSATYERILVAEDDGRLAGFAVEGVVDVGQVGDPTEETESPYLTGALLVDGALVGVVAVEALFAALAPADGDRAEAVSR